MMCTIVIRVVVGILIFDMVALLIRGAVTFVGNDSAIQMNFTQNLDKNKIENKNIKRSHQFQAVSCKKAAF